MTDPLKAIQQSIQFARQKQLQEKLAIQSPRKQASLILKKRLEDAITASGGDPLDLSVQGWIAHFAEMYVVLAWPLDRFPDWRDEGVPHGGAADFMNQWMDEAAKTLNAISPGLGK